MGKAQHKEQWHLACGFTTLTTVCSVCAYAPFSRCYFRSASISYTVWSLSCYYRKTTAGHCERCSKRKRRKIEIESHFIAISLAARRRYTGRKGDSVLAAKGDVSSCKTTFAETNVKRGSSSLKAAAPSLGSGYCHNRPSYELN